MSGSLVHGQIFVHGELWLSSLPKDYDKMWVYSGSSSSSEMSTAKEETYRIAHSLGAASSSRVVVNVDHCTIGLLPSKIVADFADACVGSFTAPEVERDLLKVLDSSLVEAVNFHAISVSAPIFIILRIRRYPCLFLLTVV